MANAFNNMQYKTVDSMQYFFAYTVNSIECYHAYM